MDIYFKVKNEAHSAAIQNALFKLGYKWVGGSPTQITCTEFSTLKFTKGQPRSIVHSVTSKTKEVAKLITLDELYDEFQPWELVEFAFNEDYTAKIRENQVDVGCQRFPNDIIDQFIETYQKAHKK